MTFWLSFADGNLPKGAQFLGVVIVDAPDFLGAVMRTHALGINPGGEVVGVPVPPGGRLPSDCKDRLLTRAEAEAADARYIPAPITDDGCDA